MTKITLKEIVESKLKQLYNDIIKEEVKSRVKEELNIISQLNQEYEFLLIYKIVNRVKKDKKIMIDRVCGSSFIAYLLGITFVNPILYKIPYNRNMTFDLEFNEDYFGTIFEYIKKIFKEENIIINNVDDLKKYRIYLNTNPQVKILEEIQNKTHKKLDDINLNDKRLYSYAIDKNNSLLEDCDKEVIENITLNRKHHSYILNLADIISLGNSTIIDKFKVISDMYNFPIIYREDIYNYLVKSGLNKDLAYEIMDFISKGKHSSLEKWNRYVMIMKQKKISDYFINLCLKIKYLFPKSYCCNRAILYLFLAYYKINF